ncbi:MAG: hypothetical protein CW342_01645 [Thermoactinomycetaceae bacterium]|nr:hypothetical protein [Bacillota bacterium]MBO2531597.1 hypothetical protein [Thermoactinomycetaceae bacterium]
MTPRRDDHGFGREAGGGDYFAGDKHKHGAGAGTSRSASRSLQFLETPRKAFGHAAGGAARAMSCRGMTDREKGEERWAS